MSMKRLCSSLLVGVMMLGLVFTGSVQADAKSKESASSLQELGEILREHALNRDMKFSVAVGDMTEDDIEYIFSEDLPLFTSILSLIDDPSTSDDADYLVGNLDYFGREDYLDINKDYTELKFSLKYFESTDETEFVNNYIPQILDDLGVDEMSNYQKVLAIHDWVCQLITWTDTGKSSESAMYGALTDHKALCNSYALCMYKLLVEAGVPCKYVKGSAGTGRDKDAHAWNLVALGDRWYCLDATWDDPEDELTHDYFLKGKEDFDECDPSEPHELIGVFSSGDFAKAFPIAAKAFDPETMDDENESVTIGGNGGAIVDPVKNYKLKDIVDGKWPASGKFTVKKGKKKDLQLYIKKNMDKKISKVTYKVTTGKSRVKNIKNYGLCEDEGESFTDLELKGKKKGKVNIKITLKLINGQKVSYTFKGKVK